jgi:hypothetical protein
VTVIVLSITGSAMEEVGRSVTVLSIAGSAMRMGGWSCKLSGRVVHHLVMKLRCGKCSEY